MNKKKTADFKVIHEDAGNRYEFYCDLSHTLVCKSECINSSSLDEEVNLAWVKCGKAGFNQCQKCGKWVIDVMYNPDVLTCVQCTPIEDYPEYCTECGSKTSDPSYFCHICGARLIYGEVDDDEKAKCYPA